MDFTFEQRLRFFRELIHCSHALYSWAFNEQFETVFSNCPDASVSQMIFALSRTREALTSPEYDHNYPIVITNTLGLIWVAACAPKGQAETSYHIIGPAFYDDVTHHTIYDGLQRMKISPALQHEFVAILDKMPVIPMNRMFEYALMLHYTLAGEKISNSELQMLLPTSQVKASATPQKHHGTWAAEQALLKLVEDGKLNHQKLRSQVSSIGNVGKMTQDNPLRQVKNQIIVYTALCTRAAIRGGLPPETAYSLSDQYIQMVESCSNVSELAEVNRTMQDDFIRRVHRAKNASSISKKVQICQDYIQMHLSEKITVETLAQFVGYSETYLSKKFKLETGKNILDYINECRIESAKQMLTSCELSIQEISEQLGFGTQSYFGAQFKKLTGMSATEYRETYGKTQI